MKNKSEVHPYKALTVTVIVLIISVLLLSAFSVFFYIKYSNGKKSDELTLKELGNTYNFCSPVVSISCGIDVENDILTDDVCVGSGFIVDAVDIGIDENSGHTNYKYLIATANHNITTDNPVICISDDYYDDQHNPEKGYDAKDDSFSEWFEAEVNYTDPVYDIAIISFVSPVQYKYLSLSETEDYILNDKIYSICTPKTLFLANTLIEGKITRSGVNGLANQYLIMTDLPLSPGCSGSPVINSDGEVIGMNLFKSTEYGTEGMSFAADAKKIAEALDNCKNGIVPTDYGIELSESFKTEYGFINYGQNQGMIVKDISEDSIFKNTELKVGYTIFAVNGTNLYTHADFYESMTPNADIFYYNPDTGEYKEFKLAD